MQSFNAAEFGGCVHAERYIIHVSRVDSFTNSTSYYALHRPSQDTVSSAFAQHLNEIDVNPLQEYDYISIPSNPSLNYDNNNHSFLTPRVVAIIENENPQERNTLISSNFILDSAFPAKEPYKKEASNTLFGRRFGIAIKMNGHEWYARPPTTSEILRIYSIETSQMKLIPLLKLIES